jgi:hypothetical protein
MTTQPERRAPMVPPSREVPPAVAQVVIELRVLFADIREHFNLERRGKDVSNGRVRV